MASDRYEPLPPFTRLPALLWSRMGAALRALIVLLALTAVAVVAVLAPRIADTKKDNAARDRREAAAARAQQIRELRELVRARSATVAGAFTLRDLERVITADARTRPDAGRILRTDCEPIRGGAGRFSCTAVTSDLPGGNVSRAGSIGYPFRARVEGRRVTWCRIAGRPGEGSNKGRPLVEIAAACGG